MSQNRLDTEVLRDVEADGPPAARPVVVRVDGIDTESGTARSRQLGTYASQRAVRNAAAKAIARGSASVRTHHCYVRPIARDALGRGSVDRSQRRRRTLRLGPVLLAASGLTVAPALVGEAAEPPFDASVSEACVNFGQGPSGGLGLEGQVSVTGAGPLRTVQARISWQGGDSADGVAVLCIADGDIVSASVSPTSSPANELTATFTVGLATSNPDLAIDSGDQVCNVGVVYAEAQVGISDIFCTDPIDLPPPDLVDEPLPSTGGSPHAGLLAGGALALLVGAMAMIIARRRTMTG